MTTLSTQPQQMPGSQVDHLAMEELHLSETGESFAIHNALTAVQMRIAPVWPLRDYVAVNPYMGYATQEFLSARHILKTVSDVELLMSCDYYRQQFETGTFCKEDIDAAVDELVADGVAGAERLDVNQILGFLKERRGPVTVEDGGFNKTGIPNRSIRTPSEILDERTGSKWSRIIRDEISKHCATHYDQGQAAWRSGWQHLPLYEAWRLAARHDRSFEILGVKRFRSFVAGLPHEPQAALALLLKRLNVPQELLTDFLLCEALTMPGWTAWTNYRFRQAKQQRAEKSDLTGLLAMRLAYEVALSEQFDFRVDWRLVAKHHISLVDKVHTQTREDLLRYALLKACELAFRRRLVADLAGKQPAYSSDRVARSLAQMVFCIDVRSERIRRHLEAASDDIETFGFAGFFGLPIEYVGLGDNEGLSQAPVLISPRLRIYEELDTTNGASRQATGRRRAFLRFMRKAWKGFQASAVSTFAFVETAGLLYGPKLIARTFGLAPKCPSRFDGVRKLERERLAPSLRGLQQQGVDTSQQVDMAESILRGIGLVDNFARLVVFCGHGSQTDNNPLKSGLDCGACGGHSGEANARLAARLLNQRHVRETLAERGIEIPADTHFVAALHNTTTDKLQFFDTYQLPSSHEVDLQELQSRADMASTQTGCERLSLLPGNGVEDLVRRSLDWSEVRPEWGLAGNAAFIAAPRDLTRGVALDGRVFLHSYDYKRDNNFAVLEQIMTAPLVVASWINMQYYASTVDPVHFGSGTKTVHNVVGQFGIFSGNGGDLMTGLPWQSIHDGKRYQHHPLRLLAVIAAPRTAIEAVLKKHQHVSDLVTHGWMQLIAIEDGSYFRYSRKQQWEEFTSKANPEMVC